MPDGNEIQKAAAIAGVADAAIARFAAQAQPTGIPQWIKIAGGIFATIFSGAILGLGVWLFGSVSEMKETLARVDERVLAQTAMQETRFNDFDRRLTMLEIERARKQGVAQ